MKTFCILREKVWNLIFNKLWKPRSIFMRILSITFHHICWNCILVSWGAFYWRKKSEKNENQKTFRRLRAKFLKMFSELHSTCLERHFELIFSKLHFSRNFADSFSAMLSKKQSSCPEKELWKTKLEKWSKVKQFFSVFDRKNVGRLVETALNVFRGTFWKLSPKNLIYYKFVSTLSKKLWLWAIFQVWL